MIRAVLCCVAFAALFVAVPASAERVPPPIVSQPIILYKECPLGSQIWWMRECKPRGEKNTANERSSRPGVDNSLPDPPGGPNVPGGDPIGGVPTPTGGGGGVVTPGCTNCGPGPGGGLGNPGNDKNVGRAGENPSGKGFGPTGRRGKNN